MSNHKPDGPGSDSDDRPDGLASDGGDEPDATTDGDGAGDSKGSAGESPLSDLARRAGRRDDHDDNRPEDDRDAAGAEDSGLDFDGEFSDGPPPDPDEDPFDRMSVEEIDEETLWSSLGSDDTASVGVGGDVDVTPADSTGTLGDVDPGPEAGSVDDAGAKPQMHVVPKTKYCQSCPHFEDPPRLACTHEGTEIVEVVDSDRFRVRNCPMVDRGVEPDE